MFWLAEDDCGAAQSAASRSLQSGLDLYLRLRGLQLGAHAKSGGHSSGGVGRGRRGSAWAGFSCIGPRNIRHQLLPTTRDEKQQAKHRIPQFFSSLLGLKVVNCQSGDALVQEQATAVGKEKVLDALGEAASKLRGELGESLASVQKLDA